MRTLLRVLLVVLGVTAGTACKGMGDITAPRPMDVPVASVVLSSEQLTVSEGSSMALQVTARDADNHPLADRAVSWSSSDSTVARVSPAGLVTGLRPGSVQIAASVDGRSAVARVTITPRAVASIQVTPSSPTLLKGAFVQLLARTLDQSGALLTDRPVFWTSTDIRVAVVDVTGLVTGVAPGVATVTATSELRSAAVGVTVLPVPVASVQVTPSRDSIVLGQSTQVTATPRDSTGAQLDDPVTFTTSAPAIATVSSSGIVVGVSPGTATITASSAGRSGTSVIIVRPRPVGAIIVSPAQATLTVGQDVTLSVQVTDANGNLLTGRPINYSSSNANVARVTSDGTVSATAPGSATITITSEGKTGTVNIAVSASPIAALRIDLGTPTMLVGATTRLLAVALDAGGNVLGQRLVTWTSGAPSVLSITADGVVTALAAGTAIVFASAEGRIATVSITVNSLAPGTLVLAPSTPSVIAGQSVDLVATLRSGTGQLIEGRPVTWSSSNNAVALVSSTGRVRGVTPGVARIDATADGITGSSNVSVVPVPVATVTVTLASSTLIVRGTTQASAVARDSVGGLLTGRVVTWSSSNSAVATVSATGLVTAVALGTANIIGTSEGRVGSAALSVGVGAATAIAANSVVTQTAAAGTAVSAPPSVKVTDAGGSPVAGVVVTFSLAGGGGTIVPASPATVTTNAAGIATLTTWTLGSTIGANGVNATVNGLSGSPVTFAATAIAGAARTIAANSVITQSTTAGTAVSAPPSVKVTDAFGNAVSDVSVTFAVTAGGGSVTPSTVITNGSGIAVLTTWTLGAAAGSNTVTATASGLTGSPVTFTATGTVGAPRNIAANSSVSQSATAGTPVSTPPSVKVTDAGGNPVSGVSVAFTVTAGGGTVTPATVSTNASGIATLTSWTLGTTAGANAVSAAVSGLTGSPVVFNAVGTPGPARNIVANSATTQSAIVKTAVSADPSVKVTDVNGNAVSGVSVAFAVTGGGGTVTPATVNTDANGVATATNWTLGAIVGTNTLTATATGLTGSPVTFTATGTPGPAAQITMTSQPSGGVSGQAFTAQPAVAIRDADGNLTTSTGSVTAAIVSGTGTLTGTTTIAAVGGVATFTNLAIIGAGPHTLRFTSGGLTAATSASFTVVPGAPAQLAIITQPGGAANGTPFTTQPVVELRDATNTPAPQSGVTVTAAKASGSGTLSGTLTATTDASGRATFANLAIVGAGEHTLTFTSGSLTSATSASFTVTFGTPTQLMIGTQPSGGVSGAVLTTQPVVTTRDAGGILTTTPAQVTAAIASGSGVLSGTTTVTTVGGVATFTNLVVTGTGAHTLRFTSGALTPAISTSFTISAGTPTQLAVVTQPSGATSGTPFTTQPAVEIRSASNVTVPQSGVPMTVSKASGSGTLSGTLTATTDATGRATFTNLVITGTGPHTLTFTSGALTAATSASFTVTAGTPTQLAMVTQPAGAVSGSAFTTQPAVELRNAGGTAVAQGGVTVTVAKASGSGTLSGTLTAVTDASGEATFANLVITGTGPHTLTFTSGALTAATSASFTVAAAPATQLTMVTQPAGAVSGAAFTTQPVVELRNASNAAVLQSGVVVTAAKASGTGTLSGTLTATTDASGKATFTNLVITGTGLHTLTFTSGALTAATSASFTVAAAPATQLAMTTQPSGAVSGAVFTTQPSVELRNSGGTAVAQSGVIVTVAKASGSGTLSGTLTATTDASGEATFTNLVITGTGPHTLTFTSGALTAATSASFTVTAGTPTQLAMVTQPAGAVNGVAFTTQPAVELRSASNVVVPQSGVVVTVAKASGSGTLSGTLTATTDATGKATFTNLVITGAGAHTLTFTSGALTAVTSSSFTVAAGTPTQLAMVTQPAGAASGIAFTTQPAVELRSAANVAVPQSGVVVTVAKASGSGTLSGTLTATTDAAGKATFTNLVITGTGAHTLTFTSGALTAATSASFTVTAGTPTQLAMTTQPSGAVSGTAFTTQPSVELRNAGGTTVPQAGVVVTVAKASGSGTLSGTLTATTDASGEATFTNLVITGTGPHTLTFTSGALTLATSASFTVAAAPPTQLAMVTQPSGAVSGAAFPTQPAVELRNASNAVVPQSGVVVTAAKASGSGTLSGTLTATTDAAGKATFTNLVITGTGAHTLTFTSGALTAATSASFTVAAAPATQLAMTTQPSGAVSGTAFTTQPSVELRNAGGTAVAQSGVIVTVAKASGSGTLSGTLTATTNATGEATFTNLVITGTGPHTLTFTSGALTAATSASFTVAAAPATQLAMVTQPAGAVSGAAFTTQPAVELRNASNTVVAQSGVVVTAAKASGSGTLSGTLTATTDAAGKATFTNLVITGTGAHTLTFTSGALTAATSASFTVAAAPATQLAMTTQPSGAVSGAAFTTQPAVELRNAGGTAVAQSGVIVTVAKASGSGTLSGTLTATTDAAGGATFTNLVITGTGAHTLTFTSGALTAATSASFTVAAGAPTQLAVTTQPAGAVNGTAFTTQPVIAIRDAGGNLTTSTASVTAAIASGSGTLTGTTTIAAVGGVATFTNLVITGTGAHTLTFTSGALTAATSASFTVAAGTPTQLAMVTQPAGAVSGTAFTTQPAVELRNAANAAVPQNGTTVTVAKASGSGTLSGTLTANTDASGKATFTNLVITGTGAHTLTFTSGALTAATTASFTVAAAPATQLAMVTQPSGAVSGTAFTTQPAVELRNASNAVVLQGGIVVTAAKATGGGTLSGTLTATTDAAGKATFTNLSITGTGAHTLSFTSGALTAATSASFTVTAPPPTQLAVTTQPGGAVTDVPFTTQPVIAIRDANGNITTSTANVTAAIASGSGTLAGTKTVAAVNGVATFTNLEISGTGPHTLIFTSGSLTSATSGSFTVAPGPATQLTLTTQPGGAVVGAAFATQPVVAIRDANGNLTTSTASVTAAIMNGGGVLSGTTTVAAMAGVATFANLAISNSGGHRLRFTSASLSGVTSANFNVAAADVVDTMTTTRSGVGEAVAAFDAPSFDEFHDADARRAIMASVMEAITRETPASARASVFASLTGPPP